MAFSNMWSNTAFFLWIPLSLCLRITEVHVPTLVDVRSQAELRCIFQLGSSRLNSVKWYKDEYEFFRYTPQPPTISTFEVAGVNVIEALSTSSVVTLHPLEYTSTGTYVCEVSSEAPLFSIDRRGANMTVIGMPRWDPRIEGVEGVYEVGDYVNANCTAAPSKPPATVHWTVDGQMAKEWLLERYTEATSDGFGDDGYEMKSRTVGLRFQTKSTHFRHGQLNLSCTATVLGMSRHVSVAILTPELNSVRYAQQNFVVGLHNNGIYPHLSVFLVSIVFIFNKWCL